MKTLLIIIYATKTIGIQVVTYDECRYARDALAQMDNKKFAITCLPLEAGKEKP